MPKEQARRAHRLLALGRAGGWRHSAPGTAVLLAINPGAPEARMQKPGFPPADAWAIHSLTIS